MEAQNKGWLERHRLGVGSLILFVSVGGGICILLVGIKTVFSGVPEVAIGVMGMWVLVTMLIGLNILSPEHDLNGAEIRRAIGISCIVVFFGLLAFGNAIYPQTDVLKALLENFWAIIMAIIGFYFGGRSAEEIVKRIISKK